MSITKSKPVSPWTGRVIIGLLTEVPNGDGARASERDAEPDGVEAEGRLEARASERA